MSADPPHPIPPYLQPIAAPLGPGDLCLVVTSDELMAITAFLGGDLNLHPSMLRIVHRDGSPWIEFAAVRIDREARVWTNVMSAAAAELEAARPQQFALWRYTLAVYRIGDDGAVEDDPIWTLKGGRA